MSGPPTPPSPAGARNSRVPVPAAVFTIDRPLPFVLFDERGAALTLREGPLVAAGPMAYPSPHDLGALRRYLWRHLRIISTSRRIEPADCAWAIHRALLHATQDLFRATEGRASLLRLTVIVREAALLQCAHAGTFPFWDAIQGAPYSQVTHAVDTALYASALATADDPRDVERAFAVAIGGLFADIAKLELPPEILTREGPLTEREWRRMRQHPHRSEQIMRRAGVITAMTGGGVRSHHERWDGSGYPGWLRGKRIPFEARCIAIADAFGAMTVNRAFQARIDPYDALLQLLEGPGEHHDPLLLQSFVTVLGNVAESAEPDLGAPLVADEPPADGRRLATV